MHALVLRRLSYLCEVRPVVWSHQDMAGRSGSAEQQRQQQRLKYSRPDSASIELKDSADYH